MENGIRTPENGGETKSVGYDEEDLIAFGELCLKAIEAVRRMNGGEKDV